VRRRRDTLSIVQIFEASQRYKPTGMTGYNPVPSSKTEHSGKDLSGEVGGCPVSPCGGRNRLRTIPRKPVTMVSREVTPYMTITLPQFVFESV
jgi:hypothetical protein